MGGPCEGQSPPVMLDDHARKWRLSDDTQLALATCEAITETGWGDPRGDRPEDGVLVSQGRVAREWGEPWGAAELTQGGPWALVGACAASGRRATGEPAERSLGLSPRSGEPYRPEP